MLCLNYNFCFINFISSYFMLDIQTSNAISKKNAYIVYFSNSQQFDQITALSIYNSEK